MGVMIHKMNYKTDKSAAECGLNLQYNYSLDNKLPLSAASYIQLYNNMGKTAYQRQISTLKIYDINTFPSWKNLREYQLSLKP